MNTCKHDNTHSPSAEAEKAWEIWKKLTDFSEWLWDQYEQQFLDFCIKEADTYVPKQPLPFD